MEIRVADSKRIVKLYQSLIYYYFDNQQREMAFDDKPYINFLSAIDEYVSGSDYYESDLMQAVVDKHLYKITEIPENYCIEPIQELLNEILRTFEINIGDHYIVIPIPRAGLESIIKFKEFSLIPRKFNRTDKIGIISEITGIPIKELDRDFTHTETSRSPDFMKHNLLILKVNNQTSYVSLNAERIAMYCVCFLRTIYFSEIHRITESTLSIFKSAYYYQENSHLVILSNDGWRKRHASLRFESECDFDLDFMSESRYQDMFVNFIDTFIFNKNLDELGFAFLNGIILFNKAYEQKQPNDDSLKLLLLITAGESLLTQNKNEKKLRLSALLSRIVKIEGCKPQEIARITQSLYLKRNDFVHAGKKVFLPYKSENELSVLRGAIAKLLANYITDYNFIIKADKNKNRYDKWVEFLDVLFDKIIIGDESVL